ncbi:MAG: succinyldiaminopimelate transaminase [Candidatus Nanopelagicales bacterium]|nr:succinyldiaminopimelate transaminase [Candidatus Nanopelagicales bacterium]
MLDLPDFPWDALTPFAKRAREHPGGCCDLSVGTPVDPVPDLIQQRLRSASDSPGYPTAQGSIEVRSAAAGWLARRLGVLGMDPNDVMSVIGTKELVAWLPRMLGLGPGDLVVTPELAYPTYAIGAQISGCAVTAADSLLQLGPARPALLWVNSPSNPTGKVLGREHLAKIVAWARERGVVVASDECYIELGWDEQPVSILHPDVCDGSFAGLLAVHSLSKRSNLAGYRYGFVAGDRSLVRGLVSVAKHAGMMVPAPVQAAAATAWSDDEHVRAQRRRYRGRRELLQAALAEAGFRIDESAAGLYLWVSANEPCWDTVSRLADLGILVAPGDLYGPRGARHVRVALTASDQQVQMACQRLLGRF